MTADQAGRIHRVIREIDGSESNLVFVLREALREERAAGHEEGYADAMADQYEASRLAEKRERDAATVAAGSED